jgi:hypothetical protein
MAVDIILKDIEWDGINKLKVPLEGGGTQIFSIGGGGDPDGDNLGYGITDGTIPRVGIAKVGSVEI